MTPNPKRALAIEMRLKCVPLPEIARILGVSKSTAYSWIKDVPISDNDRKRIRSEAYRPHSQSKSARQKISDAAKNRWETLYKNEIETTEKLCPRCGKVKSLDEFHNRSDCKYKTKCTYCKECNNEIMRLRWAELRRQVFEKLGGAKCCECGCDVVEVLDVNHVNADGNVERSTKSTHTIFLSIVNGSADISKYNVLCKVCNIKHYMEKVMGIKGHKITWKP